ncbi:drug/metabolite transporter (DMT)-like permease [Anoxybacillus tepidamans]|uniref:Drug/metabolite transporter (DMT)-like permease n=1 Tax=Anoxybacteroides tepidamans TaxID=265948 RepID=A0A7W8MU66_9BACL|nr:DMT family transporter [Anoxybacillus tepidamans]MBB5323548.1 drug/metabolite transporter (DMT)-like permease [Anoxybacillus tepidamans]
MKKQWIADASLLAVAFVWGATFVVVQNAISFLEPLSFNAVRFWLAGIFLLAWLFLFHRSSLQAFNRSLLLAGIWMGLWLFSGYALQTIGLLYTTSSKAGFITGLSVVLVPLFSFLFLKQKPTANAVFGAIIATFGLYFLTMNGGDWSINRGDLFVFFCALSFAMHIIVTGKYSSHHPTFLLTVTQIFTVAVMCSVFAFIFEDGTKMWDIAILQQQQVWTALLVTSLLATAAAFLIQTNFQKYTTPARVALIFAMEPVFAAVTAYIWAGERLSTAGIIGCIGILLGMIISELPISFMERKTIVE